MRIIEGVSRQADSEVEGSFQRASTLDRRATETDRPAKWEKRQTGEHDGRRRKREMERENERKKEQDRRSNLV